MIDFEAKTKILIRKFHDYLFSVHTSDFNWFESLSDQINKIMNFLKMSKTNNFITTQLNHFID